MGFCVVISYVLGFGVMLGFGVVLGFCMFSICGVAWSWLWAEGFDSSCISGWLVLDMLFWSLGFIEAFFFLIFLLGKIRKIFLGKKRNKNMGFWDKIWLLKSCLGYCWSLVLLGFGYCCIYLLGQFGFGIDLFLGWLVPDRITTL